MATNDEKQRVREVVGVFTDPESLQDAIDDLMTSGFDRAEISLLASEEAVVEKLGHKYKKVKELEDDPAVPRAEYVSTESLGGAQGAITGALIYVGAMVTGGAILASGGALASAILGAALGAGGYGLIGAVLSHMLGEQHAQYLHEQLEHGGLLLWVRTWDPKREKTAIQIMSKHSGRDVHAHSA
jgi:hypothetical protein